MATARGIRAGRAFVELFADDTRLVRGLRRAERKLKAFGDSIRNVGLKIAGALSAVTAPLAVLSIKAASDAQESLSRFEAVFKDQARAAGEFADALSQTVGRSRIEIRDALATFQSFFVGLGFGGGESRKLSQTLQALALDFASFHNLTDDEALGRFISALSGSSEVLDRFGINIKQAALEQQLLSMGVHKSWTEVSEQEKALARLNIIAQAMGDQGAIGDAVRTAGSFANQMKKLRGLLRDTAVAIGQGLLPVVTPLVSKVAEVVRWAGEWIARNQQLVGTIFKVAAAVIAGGLALVALGTLISALGSVFGLLATAAVAAGSLLQFLIGILGAMISPVGLVISAVAALGAYIIYATDIGAKALAWLGEKFNLLRGDALSAYRGIADALAAGDIALAVKVLWLTIRMEWTRGVNALEKAWLNFRNFFIKIGYDAWHGLLAAAEIVWHALEVGWIETTAFFTRLWSDFAAFFALTWEKIKAGAQKAWNWIKSLFDDSIDLKSENKLVEQQKQAAIARIENQQQRKLAEQEAKREADRRRASAIHEATLGVIGRENLEKHRALDSEYARRMAENEAELAKARQAWREATDTARTRRQAKDAEAGPEGLQAPDDLINKAREALAGLGDLGDLVQQEADRIGVRGTFNAAAVQGLAAGDAADRTAKASEETAKNTRKLVQAAQSGGLTFA